MLILPVGFSVITNNPIGISYWSTTNISRFDFPVKSIVESLEKTISKIHVSNWIYAFWETNASWELSIPMSPFMLNTFHMPLINNSNNFLFRTSIDLFEKVFITLINENLLEFWEVNISVLNIPVNQMWVKTFFSVLRWLWCLHSNSILVVLIWVHYMSPILESFEAIMEKVHSCFMKKSLPCFLIELWPHKVSFCSSIFGLFTCEFDFKAWL